MLNNRKTREGVVISNKMDKTIVVTEKRKVVHPIYKKAVTRTKKYFVHDEKSEAQEGDKVQITETRPLSKNKRWRLTKVIKKAV